MKIVVFISIAVFFAPSLASAENSGYQNDWNYKNFYEAINACRSSVVYPAATDYYVKKMGSSMGNHKEQLRNEVIAIIPIFDSAASDACYCALNEYAKDLKNADFIRNPKALEPYVRVRCKEKTSMKALQNKENLRLK